MITLGITGGMGSGKSYFCKVLEDLGVPIYDTDSNVKNLLNSNKDLKSKLTQKFGEQTYKDGKWNRDYVVDITKADNSVIDEMGLIIEPYLIEDVKKFKLHYSGHIYGYPEGGSYAGTVAIESAILTKSKLLMDEVDYLVEVEAPLDVRIKRIQERDPFRTPEEIKMLLSKQPKPSKDDLDFVISNDGERDIKAAGKYLLNVVQRSHYS